MADKFGGQKDGRQTTGATFYDVPAETVNANALYFPNFPTSPFFGVAEYPVTAGDLGAFSTAGVFVFNKPADWIDNPGRKVFYRPKTAATGEIVAQEIKGDVFIGYQIIDNINPQKLGVLLAPPEFCMTVLMVTSTADSGAGSLRQAVADAQDGDVILFDSDVFPVGDTPTTIYLLSNLQISKSIKLDGDGRVVLDGQSATRALYIPTNTITAEINNITIKNASLSSNGGGALVGNNANITFSSCVFDACAAPSGGGVCLNGSSALVFNDCTFDSCAATTNGGAIYSASTGIITLNACTITNCSATNGGGVCSTSTSQNTLTGCTITNCSATTNGGGVYITNAANVIFTNCTFKDNTATGQGYAVYVNSTSVSSFVGCTFVNNDFNSSSTPQITSDATTFDSLVLANGATLNIVGGITTTAGGRLNAATIVIADGAALTITDSATIGAATFTSAGRGYLATAAGIDISAATLTNVVACTYGAGLESFTIDADGASWTADDDTIPILIETKSDGEWTTLDAAATGGTYAATFPIGTIARAFDGVIFIESEIAAYFQVRSMVAPNNGGGGAGDASPVWNVENATITPNLSE